MTNSKNLFNPFPGLRPFNVDEGSLFFGRESQVASIIAKLERKKFVTIIGSSGSGKSSIINAGIIPGIIRSHKNEPGESWRIISFRPGASPIDSISRALAESVNENGITTNEKSHSDKIAKLLRNNPHGLSESLRRLRIDNKEKILIIIDNLEDLFRFSRSRNNRSIINEYENFISLLTEVKSQEALPVHIMLSIRSDFLDDCQQFGELNQMINESNYILPHLKNENLKEIINGPSAAGGIEIDPKLEKQLLADINNKNYLLPLLQHVLHRMWEHWAKQKNNDRPISLDDYDAVGKIENAISKNADEAYEELSESGRVICERMFKTITEKGVDNHEVTNPSRIADIAFVTRVGVTDIIDIVEKFRQPDHPFLHPDNKAELNSDTIIDLSHESLMKLWDRLRIWIEEESESILMYKRLADASRLYQMGKAKLWTTPELQQALIWKEKNEPSFQWAQRYNTAFERTMQFLNKSQEAHVLREIESQEKPRQALRQARMLIASAIILVLISAGVIFFITRTPSENGSPQELSMRNEFAGNEQQVTNSGNQTIATNDLTQEEPEDTSSSTSPGQANSPDDTDRPQQTTAALPVQEETPEEIPEENSQDETEPEPQTSEEINRQPSGPSQAELAAREEAMKTRMLAVSQTLAIRSQQVDDNPDLKALLALQSHIFNENYDGPSYHPDIYLSLLNSIKSLYGNNYNAYRGHTESVNSVVFRPGSSIFYSASSDGQVLQWDLNDENKVPRSLIQNSVVNNLLAISANGQWLAVATEGEGIQILNPTRNLPNPFQVSWGNNRVIALDFLPDNEHIIFAGSDNSLVKHNIRSSTNEVIAKTDSEVLSLAVSPDGSLIAVGTRSGQVLLYQDEVGAGVQIIHNEQGNDVHTVTFNNNGTRLATGSLRGEVRVLDLNTGNLIATLREHAARVVDVDFCPGGKFLASSSFDGSISIWNMQNLNNRPVILREHGSWARTVEFDSSGNKLLSGSRQETRLRAWTMDTNELASMICNEVTRNMTREEWNQYVGEDIPYMESCPQLSNR